MSEKDKMMGITVSAKPIQWEESAPYPDGVTEWTEDQYGFHIRHDPSEDDDYRYAAAWGEGDTEHFGTLEEAQAWCQSEIDGWVAHVSVIDQALSQVSNMRMHEKGCLFYGETDTGDFCSCSWQVSNTPQDAGEQVVDFTPMKKADVVQTIRSAATLDEALETTNGLAANGWLRLWDGAVHKDGSSYRDQQQEQSGEVFDADDPKFREAFEAALVSHNYPATRKGDLYRSSVVNMAWFIAYSVVNRLRLYTSPATPTATASQVSLGTTQEAAPPTSTAIAAMVIKQAAEILAGMRWCAIKLDHIDLLSKAEQAILKLSPANAEAELEALMMKVAEEVHTVTMRTGGPVWDNDLRAIVRRVLDEKGE
jgi:hypothetical protein